MRVRSIQPGNLIRSLRLHLLLLLVHGRAAVAEWLALESKEEYKQCYTDVHFKNDRLMDRKGVVLDDITFRYCPSRVPELWPNSIQPVGSIRLFRAWAQDWPDERREEVWNTMVGFIKRNNVRVLMGTPVTCYPEADERDWGWTKELMNLIGPDHVMGLAVGNELELLYQHEASSKDCIRDLWDNGNFWNTFKKRVAELDTLGFKKVPVTSVFTASIVYSGDKHLPFVNIPGQAMVNSFLWKATATYGYRYVFTFNIYPYFDPKLKIDPPKYTCESALKIATCFSSRCLASKALALARQKMEMLTHRRDDRLWIGEIGWSSPKADALSTAMATCPSFSSPDALKMFYTNFLQWDLAVPGVKDPDHAFYFTLRDALNFGNQEYFGLIESCNSPECKIHSKSFIPAAFRGAYLPGVRYAFGAAGVVLLVLACSVAVCSGRPRFLRGKSDDYDSDSSSTEATS